MGIRVKDMLRGLPIGLLLVVVLAGCLGGPGEDDLDDPVDEDSVELPEWRDDGLRMEITVPVVLFGFPSASTDLLVEQLLDGEEVVQYAWDNPMTFPPDPDELPDSLLEDDHDAGYERLPVVPTVRYEVVHAPDAVEAGVQQRIDDGSVGGSVLKGRELESYLAEAFNGTDLEPDPNAPSIVLFNGEAFKDGDPWRYTMPHGWLEPVQVFGEREPLLIIDTAESGFDLTSEGDLTDLADYVWEATHYRILQGPIYPVALPECHALTLVTAYRPTSQSTVNPMMASPLELYHPEEIAAAFTNLTGTTTYVDSVELMLPVDDPVLDLIARGEYQTSEQQRWWISENWQDYWVEHEGCEAYVSFLIHTDMASVPGTVIGLGTYDHGKGYRIAMSWINDGLRLLFDPASPLGPDDDSLERFNWVDYLHAHEGGHIFGMMHPHHLLREGVESRTDFEDVWSVMSYSTDGRVIDFGAIDRANFQRNRMGFLFRAYHETGVENETVYQQALEAAADYRWNDASAHLWDHLQDEMRQVGGTQQPDRLVLGESTGLIERWLESS